MAPLEPWEKVLVNADEFLKTEHGEISCIQCHGGMQDDDKTIAHQGLVANPSQNASASCGECHEKIVAVQQTSLHNNLAGYWQVLEARGADPHNEQMVTMFDNHCDSCHATCGECHVSQPNLVGGGLIDGHVFKETPSLTRNCTACHGSRVGKEYLGKHENILADVHFRQARMSCVDCHGAEEMHGDALVDLNANHRYEGPEMPKCENCHEIGGKTTEDNMMHDQHAGQLSCQVCHSVAYTSCDGCHVALSEKTGNPFFATDASHLGFYIGRNPIQSEERPYEYVTLRHVPIAADSFIFYGDGLLPNYDALPTWKYTTPHNIQRNTPQAETCDSCHTNAEYFLTANKVVPEELQANTEVIVETIPPSILEIFQSAGP